MKPQGIIGVVLIIVGILIFVYQGFSFTHKEQVVKAGPVEINATKRETVPISPIIGLVCVGGGIFLVLQGSRKKLVNANRIGIASIVAGAAIFAYQLAWLLSDHGESAKRREVLTGAIDQMAGTRELRPPLSVIGVVLVTGGIFTLALSGTARKP